MRVLIFGNSGSGKSTHARALAQQHGLAHLDLDTIVWEAGRIAVARPLDAVRADVQRFMAAHPAWVLEGCYGDIVEAALPSCTELLFMHPGQATCLANNQRRAWEAHKYASPEAQQSMLPFLLEWVAQYDVRTDSCSLAWHRRVFDAFDGPKRELTEQQPDSAGAQAKAAMAYQEYPLPPALAACVDCRWASSDARCPLDGRSALR